MDELLINASLQEHKPSSLPWSIDDKEMNKGNDSVDKSVEKCIFTNIEMNLMELKKSDEICERKCNDGSTYVDVYPDNPQNARGSVGVNMVNPSQVESKDKKEDLIYFGDSCLSRKDITPSVTAAVRLSECDDNTQINRRINPRCFVKVSRKMIKESKLGYSVTLQPERYLSKRKDEMSISSVPPLKKENEYETKQMNRVQIKENLLGKGCLPKNQDNVVSTSIANLKRENNGIVSNKSDECSAIDLNVDNELDSLLEITADAIDYSRNNRIKENESTVPIEQLRLTQSKDEKIRVDIVEFKSKDYESKDSSISKNLTTVTNTANCELRNENEREQKGRGNSACSTEVIVPVKYTRDKIVDVMTRQMRRVENIRVKDLGDRNKREVTQDIGNKMDIIDGIGVEGFDKEAQETQRKKPNTKKFKREKRQEKKEGDVVLETETEPRNTERIRRNNAKGDKYKESILSGNYVGHRMSTKRTLMDETESAEGIFDISPIKNKETLSDLEDDGSNKYGKYIERSSDLMKKDDRKEHKKNDEVNVVCNNVTKPIPEQTQEVPSKDKSKRSKKGKGENVTNTIKKTYTKLLDELISHKKQKKKKSKKVSKTSVKNELLPIEESTGRNKSDNGRQSAKTCDLVPVTNTVNVNLHVHKADNVTTHIDVDDQNDRYKTRHRAKSSQSNTVIKCGMSTVTRIDMRLSNECDTEKGRRELGNPFMRQDMTQENVNSRSKGKPITDSEQYQNMSGNTWKNDNDVKSTNVAKIKEYSNQGNISNFQDMKFGYLKRDSEIDLDMISDIQYQQYLTHRPSSEASSEFEFPRPASNNTFIIDRDNVDEDSNKSLHQATGSCNQQCKVEEKKLSTRQRLINFIMCCFRPKTD